ncbi:outer membrane biogenesis protein BamB [Maioricimonas rarisocia]|uniref:Outer membrane biogenesis protein BamB n=1 Tax=Maioricimonas rarisocia TaxID=2528026 RepID=A0A517ZES7_9PLAN|nr:PQQ-binding-like beta-propeller repeat protein [Maioricimonas rarisocia]QDU40990.1 outer membrane biogenesis protein BamB [Maioricimonas rarisocia]
MTDLAVIPILPTLHTLLLALPVGIVALLMLLRRLAEPGMPARLLRLGWRLRGLLLTCTAVAGLVIFAATRSGARFEAHSDGVSFQPGHWPTARGDLQRLGVNDPVGGPTGGGINWKTGGPTQSYYATPAIAGDRLYCVASSGGRRGRIECRSLLDGGLLWTAAPAGYRATFSSPVLSSRYLVCGEGLHNDRMARIVCIDVAPHHVGELLWTFQTNSHVECTPVIDGERVYAGAGDDGVYCLQLDPDIPEDERLVWHVSGRNLPDAETSLAVHNGRVYVGLGNGGEAVCVLDAATGQMIRRLPMPYPVFGLPAIDGERLYVGMGRGDYVHAANDPAGQVCCIDLNSLTVEWTYATPATVLGAVAVAGDDLLFASADGTVHRLDRNGDVINTWESGERVLTSPAVTDDAVYIVTGTGRLYGLTRDLKPFWQVEVGGARRCVSSPVVASGQVCFGTEEAGLISAGSRAAQTEPVWHGQAGGNAAFDTSADPLPVHGRVHWQWPAESRNESTDITAAVGVIGDHILVPVANGPEAGLVCLRWNASGTGGPAEQWHHREPAGIHVSPAAAGRQVFVTTGQPGETSRELRALALDTGNVEWRHPVSAAASGRLYLGGPAGNSLCIADVPDGLSLLTTDGHLHWRSRVGHVRHPVAMEAGRILTAGTDPPSLVLLDGPTGRTLWRVPLDSVPTTSALLLGDHCLVGTRAGLEWRRLLDGERIEQTSHAATSILPHDEVTSLIRTGDSSVTWGDASNAIHVLDCETGDAHSIAMPERPGRPLHVGGHLLFADEAGLDAVVLRAGASPRLWCDLSKVGTPAAPGVWSRGILLLPVDGGGLVGIGE